MSKISSKIAIAQQLIQGIEAVEKQTNAGIVHSIGVATAGKPVYQSREYILSQVPVEQWMPLADQVRRSLLSVIAGRLIDDMQRKQAFVDNGMFHDPESNTATYRFKTGVNNHEFRLILTSSLEHHNPTTKECSVRFLVSIQDKFVNVGDRDACRLTQSFGLANNTALTLSTLSPQAAISVLADKACEMIVSRCCDVNATNVFKI